MTQTELPVHRADSRVADSPTPSPTSWSGVVVMMFTSFVLVVAEFLPPSMLPAMAASLGVSEGQAGQAVTATALVGFLTAPTIGLIFPRLDRRTLLASLTIAAAISNIVVAVAPNLWLLLLARLLLGASIGGFWAMSLAVAARLARPENLGRAMMLVNTGTSAATVAGVPLGIYLSEIFDWEKVFVGVAVVSVIVAIALRMILPPVPPARSTGLSALGATLRVSGVGIGLFGHVLVVMGHFAAFAYIRPALERVPGLDASGAAVLLVVFGIGSVAGNFIVGMLIDRYLSVIRYVVPLGIGAAVAVIALAPQRIPVVGAVALWGFMFGAWIIVVTTWMGRVAPDRMEAGGGLLVAGFQLAIVVGAGAGGLLVDISGPMVALVIAAVSTLIGGVLFGSARSGRDVTADRVVEVDGPRSDKTDDQADLPTAETVCC